MMKQTIELTCAACGEKFTAEADYILEGVQGFVINSKGERVEFIDPTVEHHCDECVRKIIEDAKKGVNEHGECQKM